MSPRVGRSLASGFLLIFAFLSMSGVDVEPDRRKVEPRLFHAEALVTEPAREQAIGAPPAATAPVPVFIRTAYDDPAFPERIRNVGGTANRITPFIYTARLPLDSLRYASNWPSIAYIEAGRRVRPLLDLSRPAVLADSVQNGTGLPNRYTGQGVLVGIVDTGLDGTHPDFLSGTPVATRVVHTFTFAGADPSMQDTDGHGTHVAGIAAGNGRASNGLYTGMAPRANLMIARAGIADFTDTNIISGVMDLFGYADSVSSPAAVNLSLGVMDGPHDGTSSFEAAINSLATGAAAGSRRLVSVAAGNEQTGNEHFRAVVTDFGSTTATLSLLANGTSATTIVDIWADGEDRYTVTAVRAGDTVTAASGSSANAPTGLLSVSNRVDAPPNHGTHIQVFFSNPGGSPIPASVRFDRVRNGGSGTVDAYVDFLSGAFTGTGIATTGTTIEPANGDNVIAAASFQTKAHSGGAFVPGSLGISSFSSTGPTRDARTKPDVAAPGEFIFSARSSQASFSSGQIVPADNDYVIEAGTSMAAPHVAGIAALVWESNAGLTGAQMRERLRRTADAVGASPNTTWGFGKVNALRAVRETVASISAPAHATPGTPVSLTSGNSSGGFGTPISAYLWSAPGAVLSTTNQAGTTFTAGTPGNYTVSLTATAGTSSGSDSRNILVNTIPTAEFTVPASDNVGNAVTFRGTASDPDGQPVTFRWQVVSRPAGSSASITGASVDNAVFTPDAPGAYEIGLRVSDGLENSALVVHSYTAQSVSAAPASSSGGGGGCSALPRTGNGPTDGESPLSAMVLLLPAAALSIRRMIRSLS